MAGPAAGRARRPRRLVVVANPYATAMSARVRAMVLRALASRFDVAEVGTEHRGHATELARAAAAGGCDAVVAFGGDGTVNEVANGLARTPTPLAILPGGATNVYARMLGLPTDVVDATERLLVHADAWAPHALDLGRVDGRGFLFAAGVGLDATVVAQVDAHPELKARFGPWYFAGSAIATYLGPYASGPPRLAVSVAGRELTGMSLFVANGRAYTYFRARPIELSAAVALDSGDLAGAVLERARARDLPGLAVRALARRPRLAGHRRVAGFARAGELRVRSLDGRPVALQVDGDHLGSVTEAAFAVEPGVLRVLV